ncbi:MAG: prephenate dehydratase [Coriobacteriales bacterium]|jgi:prephenate dehydratase|nr:prephenate dehydratase [Coriobacteriales bacterium]
MTTPGQAEQAAQSDAASPAHTANTASPASPAHNASPASPAHPAHNAHTTTPGQAADSYAYLGPLGTYSHQATLTFTADAPGATLVECVSISEIFDLVDRGRVAYGVVPIENALEGSVNETLDAFAFTSGAQILGETVVDIHHDLIVRPGVELADVRTVVSHPQALGQCRRWLAEHLRTSATLPSNSTSEGVRQAVADTQGQTAAIGTALAAELFGGQIRASQIEDHYGNQTRFVLIATSSSTFSTSSTSASSSALRNSGGFRPSTSSGAGRAEEPQSDAYKTSLALFMKEDRPGTLLMILEEFAYAGVNLSKIQSRPTKRALGDYMFWIDIDAHADDLHVKTALDCLRLKLREVKLLGSYPRVV